jgi:hypothetical protein
VQSAAPRLYKLAKDIADGVYIFPPLHDLVPRAREIVEEIEKKAKAQETPDAET